MPYQRPQAATLGKQERLALLREYYRHYRRVAEHEPEALNRKLPREAFGELLNQVGSLLVAKAAEFADGPGAVRDFLDRNPLPAPMARLLPDDFRVFCLAMNALKQWVSAEQAATDRFVLGGDARQECRCMEDTCLVTGEGLDRAKVKLHHPVRDGRPPIPSSKEGHDQLEGQLSRTDNDSLEAKLRSVREKSGRSWKDLRRGCLDLVGAVVTHSTPQVARSSKQFARDAAKATGLSYEDLLGYLDRRDLGRLSR